MISSVLNLWVCLGLILSVTVFIWMLLFFDPFDFAFIGWFSVQEKAVRKLLPIMDEPWWLEQSMISSVLNLWVCRGLFSSVTVFIWMRLFFDPFDFRCLRDVPFRKRLFRSSFQEWVNPGGSSGQWLAPFWIFEFALDLFGLWRSLYESACFSTLILHVYLMFTLETGCYEAPPTNGWTLVKRPVND